MHSNSQFLQAVESCEGCMNEYDQNDLIDRARRNIFNTSMNFMLCMRQSLTCMYLQHVYLFAFYRNE